MSIQTNLSAWIEWREQCALDRCCSDSKAVLQAWAKKLAYSKWSGTLSDQLDSAWHLFETRFLPAGTERDRTPKIMMFAAGVAASTDVGRLRVLEDYARKVLFSALRDCAVEETWGRRDAQKGFSKLPIVRPDAPDSPPLEDLLPDPHFRGLDPREETERNEFEKIAFNEATEWFQSLSNRQRVVLGAFFSPKVKSLADPKVLELAGCKQSQVYVAKEQATRPLVELLAAKYSADNDQATVRELTELVLRHLGAMCVPLFDAGKTATD